MLVWKAEHQKQEMQRKTSGERAVHHPLFHYGWKFKSWAKLNLGDRTPSNSHFKRCRLYSERRRNKERKFSIFWFTPQMIAVVSVFQESLCGLPHECRVQDLGCPPVYFQAINRELDCNWNSQDLNPRPRGMQLSQDGELALEPWHCPHILLHGCHRLKHLALSSTVFQWAVIANWKLGSQKLH